VHPDLTVLIAHCGKGYYRPYFFEVERTHKNYERLRLKMRAYEHLFSRNGNRGVGEIFSRELARPGFKPAPGMAVFVAADLNHSGILKAQAAQAVKKDTEIWFTSLEKLVELKELKRKDGSVRQHRGKPLMVETPIAPKDFFSQRLLFSLRGRLGSLVV